MEEQCVVTSFIRCSMSETCSCQSQGITLCVSCSDVLSKTFGTNHGWDHGTVLCGLMIWPSSVAVKSDANHQVINIHLVVVNERNVVLIMVMQLLGNGLAEYLWLVSYHESFDGCCCTKIAAWEGLILSL